MRLGRGGGVEGFVSDEEEFREKGVETGDVAEVKE